MKPNFVLEKFLQVVFVWDQRLMKPAAAKMNDPSMKFMYLVFISAFVR